MGFLLYDREIGAKSLLLLSSSFSELHIRSPFPLSLLFHPRLPLAPVLFGGRTFLGLESHR